MRREDWKLKPLEYLILNPLRSVIAESDETTEASA